MPRARHDPHQNHILSPLPSPAPAHPAPASSSSSLNIINPVPRSSSLHSMGQVLSSPSPPPSPSKSLGGAGQRLRRVFATRKKKAEDHVDQAPYPPQDYSPPSGRLRAVTAPTPPSSRQDLSSPSYTSVQSAADPRRRPPPLAAQSSLTPSPRQGVFGEIPPPPPPKSPRMDPGSARTPRSAFVASPEPLPSPSPNLTSAKPQSSESQEPSHEPPPVSPSSEPPSPAPRVSHEKKDPEQERMKEDWRKSDATMSSYHTVRPRSIASGGVRTRPVSMAESLHSNSTVMATNKRLSALLTEAEFIMTEEDVSTDSRRTSLTRQSSPSSSVKTRKRHSISLHFTSPFPSTTPPSSPPASDASHGRPRRPNGETPPSSATLSASPVPNVTRTAARSIIGGSQKEGSIQSTGSHIKGRLAALTTNPSPPAASAPTHVQNSRSIPQGWAPAPTPPTDPPRRSPGSTNTTFRQPAVSISSTALGFGKRAVERMGRAFGGIGGSSSSSSSSNTNHSQHALGSGHGPQSGYSSSSSSIGGPEEWVAHKGKMRHTPNAPSGTWSISTSATGSSTSDSLQGPQLGPRIRAPFASSGVVFGRPLEVCVRDSALEHVRSALNQAEEEGGAGSYDAGVDAALEQRLLPALVVRCVQHIRKWGIEEEGLFRISGRTSTISKLRSEFDTGADFDLVESPPGDLDPHAVTSIFKAYLRELPEPILTKSLNPLFEAAMNAENDARKSVEAPAAPKFGGARRSALPTNPRDGRSLMKPPSLSTLAMPNFAAMRPPSEALLDEFASLIARLPLANRDLLRTVTDLIKETATRRETRMPLSNLTVVFCPSLNMSPSILRVLCEAEGIWDGPRNKAPPTQPTAPLATEDKVDSNANEDVRDDAPAASKTEDDSRSVASSSRRPESVDTRATDARATLLSTTDDSGSYFSASDSRPPSPREYGQDPSWVPPDLSSSSSSSIATPSTVSEDPPVSTSGLSPDVSGLYDLYSKPVTPIIAALEGESLAGGRPFISAPMPAVFPSSRDPSPSQSASPRGSTHVDAMPPGFGGGVSEAASRSTSKLARSRRPSLAVLFSKRSMSSIRSSRVLSISSPYLNGSSSGDSSPLMSPSTPHSTLAQPPTAILPPVLDTAIDSSRIDLSLGMQSPADTSEGTAKDGEQSKEWESRWGPEADGDSQRRRAGSSVDVVRPRNARPSRLTAASSPHLPGDSPPLSEPSKTPGDVLSSARGATSPPISAATSSSNRLSLWDDDDDDSPRDDDWANSVLLAADAGWLTAETTAA
ncbi:hypothetical protein OF83DRAFT_1168758 [Amylostereum chailletii]|nr:hypothetical protein OF83DRAFT_1168758 [Amylostereum chailletii]